MSISVRSVIQEHVPSQVRADHFYNHPPAHADGKRVIVGVSPSGVFVGHENDIAWSFQGVWMFDAPEPGWRVYVTALAEEYIYHFNRWQPAIVIEQKGDIVAGGSNGIPVPIPIGAKGQVFTVKQVGLGQADLEPRWEDPTGGLENPMTKRADIIVGGQDGEPTALEAPESTDTNFLTTRLNDTLTQREVRWQNKILPSNVLVASKSLLGCRDTTSNIPAENIAVGEGLDIEVINEVATLTTGKKRYYLHNGDPYFTTTQPGAGIAKDSYIDIELYKLLGFTTLEAGMWKVKLTFHFVCKNPDDNNEQTFFYNQTRTVEFTVTIINYLQGSTQHNEEYLSHLKVSNIAGNWVLLDKTDPSETQQGTVKEEDISIVMISTLSGSEKYHKLRLINNMHQLYPDVTWAINVYTRIDVELDEFTI